MTKRLLLVNDELENFEVIESALTSLVHRCEIFRADNVRSGLDQLGRRVPDLVILDMVKPGAPVLDALSDIRTHLGPNRVPVILVSANADGEQRSRELGAGAT